MFLKLVEGGGVPHGLFLKLVEEVLHGLFLQLVKGGGFHTDYS